MIAESKDGILHTIELTCDAKKGKGICGNSASASMQSREACGQFLFAIGWRLLRGHQVCGSCMAKGVDKIHFRRQEKVS